jgi:hypothetical protein
MNRPWRDSQAAARFDINAGAKLGVAAGKFHSVCGKIVVPSAAACDRSHGASREVRVMLALQVG